MDPVGPAFGGGLVTVTVTVVGAGGGAAPHPPMTRATAMTTASRHAGGHPTRAPRCDNVMATAPALNSSLQFTQHFRPRKHTAWRHTDSLQDRVVRV